MSIRLVADNPFPRITRVILDGEQLLEMLLPVRDEVAWLEANEKEAFLPITEATRESLLLRAAEYQQNNTGYDAAHALDAVYRIQYEHQQLHDEWRQRERQLEGAAPRIQSLLNDFYAAVKGWDLDRGAVDYEPLDRLSMRGDAATVAGAVAFVEEIIGAARDEKARLKAQPPKAGGQSPPPVPQPQRQDPSPDDNQAPDIPADKLLSPGEQANALYEALAIQDKSSGKQAQSERAKLAMKVRKEARRAGLRLRCDEIPGKGEHVHADDWPEVVLWWKGKQATEGEAGAPRDIKQRMEAERNRNGTRMRCDRCRADFLWKPGMQTCPRGHRGFHIPEDTLETD